MPLAPAQVHAQQHLGPVLRLGTAGTGLDIEEGAGLVHLAGEHAPEFQPGDLGFQRVQVGLDNIEGFLVTLLGGHLQQFARIAHAVGEPVERQHHVLEPRTLAAQLLGTRGIVPDVGFFQFANDLGQLFRLAFEVKGTP